MAVRARLLSAAASDMGRRRTNNEDRYYVDPERGIFAVIDGVGGHAAGEQAAAIAAEVLRERLERQTGTPEDRIREAIALANNEIYRRARTRADWNGMACVLTVALIEDDVVTVGHVGDSRLYLLRPGSIRKMTPDHSPVGEREDRGEIEEADAMRHPRRNEIYRDVGTTEHTPHDPAFIDTVTFGMPADGAILLCSDGLTDLVGSAEIRAGMERYAPDYETAIAALIDAANQAGGKDNITIVIVAAPGYKAQSLQVVPPRRPAGRLGRGWLPLTAALVGGLALGVGVGLLVPVIKSQLAASGPRTLVVGAAGINATLLQAHSGDTVIIPEGRYKERIELREGVAVRARRAGTVTLISPDGKPPVVADKVETGSLEGVWIQGNSESPASIGIQLVNSSPTISNVRVTGANTGIDVSGVSAPLITSSKIANNLGAGIQVTGPAKPQLDSNLIAANGNGTPGTPMPGIDVQESARPVLKDNGIVDNAAEPIWIHGHTWQPADFQESFFGGLPLKKAVRMVDEPPPPVSKAPASPVSKVPTPKKVLP
jgi:serine/threonine protein phosphatase PrpC